MACNVRDDTLNAIWNTIGALIKENPTWKLSDIRQWFNENYGDQITEQQILDSIVVSSPKKVDEAKSNLIKAKNRVKREAEVMDKLGELVNKLDSLRAENIAPEKEMNEVMALTGELFRLINGNRLVGEAGNRTMSNLDKHMINTRLNDIQLQYSQFFGQNKKISDLHLKTIKNAITEINKTIREDRKGKSLDRRLEDLQKKIEVFQKGEVDAKAVLDPDAGVEFETVSAEIFEKENRIAHYKNMFEKYKHDRRLEEKVRRIGLFGFKDDMSMNVALKSTKFFSEAWESMRKLKFMFDNSAIMTQGAPMAIIDLTSIDINKIASGDFLNAFAGQRRLGYLFRRVFWDVLGDDLAAAKAAYKAGDPAALRRAQGTLAIKLLREIQTHPMYGLAKKSKLPLSETRSREKSEEMFHSSLLNEFRGLGIAGDISEDLMVTALNHWRFTEFVQWVEANPGLPDEQYARVAHMIGAMTGSSPINVGDAQYAMSAPRLMMARLTLAFQKPVRLVFKGIDLKKTLSGEGLPNVLKLKSPIVYHTPADAYIGRQLYRMYKGFGLTFAAIAGLAAMGLGIGFGDDWEESDFLRVRANNTMYDYTGGMGAMYRMLAQIIIAANGPSDGASYLAKRRANMDQLGGGDPLDAAIKTLVKNRLHPGVNSTRSILTGKDFMGQVYNDIFPALSEKLGFPELPVEVTSRLEGTLRSLMPIFIEVAMDQNLFTPNSGITEDQIIGLLQFHGVNTFEFRNKGENIKSRNFMNRIGHKGNTDYPEQLKPSKVADTKSLQYLYLREKYKDEYGDMVGEIIESNPNMTKSQFQARVKSAGERLQKQFVREHKGDIDKLPKPK